jgi:hypothetical protein
LEEEGKGGTPLKSRSKVISENYIICILTLQYAGIQTLVHSMMPTQYLRVFRFYLHVMRKFIALYDVCGTQVYKALLIEGLRTKQIMTCKTVVSETISIWNSPVGYGNVISTRQFPMFQNMLPPNSGKLGTATRLCITITPLTKCLHLKFAYPYI